jgi:RNA polymerase sigma-70 factor (ECF subfamily)
VEREGLVEDLFRRRYGALVASLCRILGPEHLELVEDVVQEAMLRALRTWPVEGVPERPDGWVFRVARNLALDSLRRSALASRVERSAALEARRAAAGSLAADPDLVADDTLRMMFTCCHPAVPQEARVSLVLKTVAGFGTSEIAAALLAKEGTIAQRLTRSRAKLQAERVAFEVPSEGELPARLPQVLEVLYLIFNEGYRAHRGAGLVRRDLVEEAVRLCDLLLERASTATPEVHALQSLMLLLGARLPARTDAHGELVTLAEQDRALWDRAWLSRGFAHLRGSLGGERLTAYHVEAAIASLHAVAPSYAMTDWARVVEEYDRLLGFHDTPVVRLNRAVAVAKLRGPAAGLQALSDLPDPEPLDEYFLLPAVRGYFRWQLGAHAEAARDFVRALELPCTEPERRFMERRLEACRRAGPAPQ